MQLPVLHCGQPRSAHDQIMLTLQRVLSDNWKSACCELNPLFVLLLLLCAGETAVVLPVVFRCLLVSLAACEAAQ